jgi:hypothetical protein
MYSLTAVLLRVQLLNFAEQTSIMSWVKILAAHQMAA